MVGYDIHRFTEQNIDIGSPQMFILSNKLGSENR